MRGFLRFIGVIELIGYFIGIILWFIYLPFSGWNILYFFVYLIFAPSFACVCFTCANLIDKNEALERAVKALQQKNGSPVSDNKQKENGLSEKEQKPDVTFRVGDLVTLLNDAPVSRTDSRIIPSGTEGMVASVHESFILICLKLDGCDVYSPQQKNNLLK